MIKESEDFRMLEVEERKWRWTKTRHK
jgi:hypothetical protein